MSFDTIQQIKADAANMLLLLLLTMMVASSASPLQRCGENKFFDQAAQICTNCDEICNPLRGTEYLCKRHADECRPHTLKSISTSRPISMRDHQLDDKPTDPDKVPVVMVLIVITVSCTVVATVVVTSIIVFFCMRRHCLCFGRCSFAQRTGRSTVVPATAVSASKEAIAPSQIIRPTAEVTALLNQANGDVGYDIGNRSPSTIS